MALEEEAVFSLGEGIVAVTGAADGVSPLTRSRAVTLLVWDLDRSRTEGLAGSCRTSSWRLSYGRNVGCVPS